MRVRLSIVVHNVEKPVQQQITNELKVKTKTYASTTRIKEFTLFFFVFA